MRIAFVVGKFPKLSKTFILSQITGLIDRGHEVDIYATLNRGEYRKNHGDIEKYSLLDRIIILPDHPNNPGKKLAKACLHLIGANFYNFRRLLRLATLPIRGFRCWQNAWIYSSLPKLEGKTYDIIHCHFADNCNDALSIKEITSPRAKIITTFHGYDVNITSSQCNATAYQKIFEQGDLFTANTNFTAKKASLLGCPIEKIEILPVGLDVSKYSFHPRTRKDGEKVKLLTVGRLVEKKGIDYTLRAIAKAKEIQPNLDLAYSIIGEGEMHNILANLVEELGISDSVTFLGAMTQEEVQAVYRSAHIFILSSVTASNGDMEGQGLVIQEAQCVGLPVISTLHNGIPDGVLDGKSGFLVPEKDVDALAKKILYLCNNSEIWPDIGQAGHQFIISKYNIEDLNDRLVELYKSVL